MNAYVAGFGIFFVSCAAVFALSLRLFESLEQRRLEAKKQHQRED